MTRLEEQQKLEALIRQLPAEFQPVMDIMSYAMNSRDNETSNLFRDIKGELHELNNNFLSYTLAESKEKKLLSERTLALEKWKEKVMWSLIVGLLAMVLGLVGVIYATLL